MHELRPPVNSSDNHTGNSKARITLVEYGDYQCPYCGLVYPIIKQLLSDRYEDIAFVFRHFPLQSIHPYSMVASLSAEAAAEQGQFWPMHDLIYKNQINFNDRFFKQLAKDLNLNQIRFESDINSAATFSKVNRDFKSGLHSGVNGTPSFFINNLKIELPELSYQALANEVDQTKLLSVPSDLS